MINNSVGALIPILLWQLLRQYFRIPLTPSTSATTSARAPSSGRVPTGSAGPQNTADHRTPNHPTNPSASSGDPTCSHALRRSARAAPPARARAAPLPVVNTHRYVAAHRISPTLSVFLTAFFPALIQATRRRSPCTVTSPHLPIISMLHSSTPTLTRDSTRRSRRQRSERSGRPSKTQSTPRRMAGSQQRRRCQKLG